MQRQGSPPRVRGKDLGLINRHLAKRITPACAGKSHPWTPRSRSSRDHPRVCGEKILFTVRASATLGSPPRVRGKAPGGNCTARAHRITPACAGKSLPPDHVLSLAGDHPRVCGEKVQWDADVKELQGSPPRVRGKDTQHIICSLLVGITPACAGKSRL